MKGMINYLKALGLTVGVISILTSFIIGIYYLSEFIHLNFGMKYVPIVYGVIFILVIAKIVQDIQYE